VKRTSVPACALALALLALPGSCPGGDAVPDPESPEFAAYVMNRIDDQYRGERSHGVMEMHVKTVHWERTISLEAWSLGKDFSLVRILSPKKDRGTATLKAESDLFTFLAKTGKTIKITEGMMGGSWMGSHFTNDDLVKHTRLSEDYDIEKVYSGEASGTMIHRFKLVPKPDAPVVWGKIVVSVRQLDLQPLRQLFYDEDGKEVRVLKFSEHSEIEGRIVPRKMVMKPLDGSGEYTQVLWKEIDFDVDIDKGFFSVQKLKSL